MKKVAIRVHDRKQAHALDALLGGLISNCPWALIAGIYLFPDRKTVDWNESDDTAAGKFPAGYTLLDFVTDMPAIVKFFAEGEEDKPPFEIPTHIGGLRILEWDSPAYREPTMILEFGRTIPHKTIKAIYRKITGAKP